MKDKDPQDVSELDPVYLCEKMKSIGYTENFFICTLEEK